MVKIFFKTFGCPTNFAESESMMGILKKSEFEIVDNPEEAFDYLTYLKLILQYIGASDCDMEKGFLRCDANISLRLKGETSLGTKVELKNMLNLQERWCKNEKSFFISPADHLSWFSECLWR